MTNSLYIKALMWFFQNNLENYLVYRPIFGNFSTNRGVGYNIYFCEGSISIFLQLYDPELTFVIAILVQNENT